MAYEVLMPRLGWNMEEGTLVEWLFQDGAAVKSGELVCVIEGDKATNEVESFETGVLRIPPYAPEPGTLVPVGTLLGYIVPEPELATFEFPAPSRPVVAVMETPDAVTNSAQATPVRSGGPRVSPRARRVARELGVDWRRLSGSGLTGRIRERDVRAAAKSGATATPDHLPMTGLRKAVAAHVVAAMRTVAPVTLTTDADATRLVALREKLKQTSSPVPAFHDLLAKLVGQALTEHPHLNATLKENQILLHRMVNIGIAVDTDAGLVAPVVRHITELSLTEITQQSTRLIADARAGRVSLDALQDGTFTITNLGMYDIDAFTPIINLPQCAILGVGRIEPRVVVIDEETATTGIRKRMALSLTFDHRLVDGGPAARFLQRVKRLIEVPETTLG